MPISRIAAVIWRYFRPLRTLAGIFLSGRMSFTLMVTLSDSKPVWILSGTSFLPELFDQARNRGWHGVNVLGAQQRDEVLVGQ